MYNTAWTNSLINTFRQASFAVDLSLFKMSVVAPAVEMPAMHLSEAIAKGTAAESLKKKNLSIEVGSRSTSPIQEEDFTPSQAPERKNTKLSAEVDVAATRKRRRA